MKTRSFIDQLHLDITNYIKAMDCKPTNIIYPNMANAPTTKPYWNVAFLTDFLSDMRVTGEITNTLLLQIDLVVDKGQGTSDINDWVSAISKAFCYGRRIGRAQVARPPERTPLGSEDGSYRVALTIRLNYFNTPATG